MIGLFKTDDERAAFEYAGVPTRPWPLCRICGGNDRVAVRLLMGTDDPICSPCLMAWYDSGEVTIDGIRAARGLPPIGANDATD